MEEDIGTTHKQKNGSILWYSPRSFPNEYEHVSPRTYGRVI